MVSLSRDGRHFGSWKPVNLDEISMARPGDETYGDLMIARYARAVRVRSDVPLRRLSVLALTDRQEAAAHSAVTTSSTTFSAVPQPTVIPRSGWGADESLRFDSTGKEIWPPQFWPVQKLIVHHTATQNNDPNPAATIRSIYYYHAVTQSWGDIGYNFLIDEAGNIYEGRYSRAYAPGASPTGQDLNGNGVTAAHAQGFNSGTVGIALLGTLTNQDATPAARDALERLLAWEADGHGIDPQGSAPYTNPVSGAQATFPNIAGHRDVAATECPGGVFYGTLPTIRSDVAARIAAAHGTPAPASKSYQPAGYTILSGSVYRDRGAVSRLYANDESRLEVTTASTGYGYAADLYAYASITPAERSTLRKLAIDYDGNASGSSTALTLSVYDWATGTWTTVDGPRTGITTDRSFTWSTTTAPTDYVSPAGEIRYRIRGTAGSSFRTRTDLVRFTIEY